MVNAVGFIDEVLKDPKIRELQEKYRSIGILTIEKTPVDLDTFLFDKEYLGIESVSPRQARLLLALDKMNPDDPELKKEFCLVVGKGGGKDFCISIANIRLAYRLSLEGPPSDYTGKTSHLPITLLNVAVNAEQANAVYFSTFSTLGKNIFKKLGCQVKQNEVIFPNNVIVVSGNSEAESQEGYNLFSCTLDEIAAFKTEAEMRGKSIRSHQSAKYLYDMAKSSITSRFPKTGKVMLISYPRFDGDFILQKYEEGLNNPNVYTEFAKTWEFNPYAKEEDFEDEKKRDFREWSAKYCCEPPKAKDAYFTDEQRVRNIVDLKLKDPYLPGDIDRLENSFFGQSYNYFLGLDLAIKGDRAGLALCHREVKDNREHEVVIDLLRLWEAPPNGEINFEEIRKFIFLLRDRRFLIKQCCVDSWQSWDLKQILTKNQIPTENKYSCDKGRKVYDTYKDLVNQGKIRCCNCRYTNTLIEEMLGLGIIGNKKIDHCRPGTGKDISDSVALSVFASSLNMGASSAFCRNW